MDIQVSSPNAVYITINKVTYYIDESMAEEGTIIDCWHEDDEYNRYRGKRIRKNKIKFSSSTLTNYFNSKL